MQQNHPQGLLTARFASHAKAITLKHAASGRVFKVLVFKAPNRATRPEGSPPETPESVDVFLRLDPPEGEGTVRMGPNGAVNHGGGLGPWALFALMSEDNGSRRVIRFRSMGNWERHRYLCAATGAAGSSLCSTGDAEMAKFEVVEGSVPIPSRGPSLRVFSGTASLTPAEAAQFFKQGYVQCNQVVPVDLIAQALRRINCSLGVPGNLQANPEGGKGAAPVMWEGVGQSVEILNLLLGSTGFKLAESLIGDGQVLRPHGGQVALRFPEDPEVDTPEVLPPQNWHIDGIGKGRLCPFTLLVGITLTECTEDFAGNFTVFPGSHHTIAPLVQQHGDAAFIPGSPLRPDVGPAHQVRARPGDVILVHPKLAHRGGLNTSPNIRYQIYFRLKHVRHDELWEASLSNMWIEYAFLGDLQVQDLIAKTM